MDHFGQMFRELSPKSLSPTVVPQALAVDHVLDYVMRSQAFGKNSLRDSDPSSGMIISWNPSFWHLS